MHKLLYLTVWDFKNAEFDGICKKISAQVKCFKNMGFCVDFGYTKANNVYLESDGRELTLGRTPESMNIIFAPGIFAKHLSKREYDAVYIRHCVVSPSYLRLLAILRKTCKKVAVEIPTYPYDIELKKGGLPVKIAGYMDQILRGNMKKYVDKVITYSNDNNIFGIDTIKTVNGIDFSGISQIIEHKEDGNIHLLGVAMLQTWHGYDRIIAGLHEYYLGAHEKTVIFHIVGEGPASVECKKMVQRWDLEPYVIFHGVQSGNALDELYSIADIAVVSIGLHRLNAVAASTLKAREYGSKGMLMISENAVDFLPSDSPYVFTVPADDSPVQIERVVNFISEIRKTGEMAAIRSEIRDCARRKADMAVTLQPVKEYFLEEVK